MKRTRLIALTSGSLALIGLVAAGFATGGEARSWQGWGRHGGGHGADGHLARMCTDRSGRTDALVAHLEPRLALTSAQQAPWRRLVAALKSGEKQLATACRRTDADAGTPTVVASLTQAEGMMAVGLGWIKRVRPAYEDFHAVLTDAQKSVIDDMMANGGHRWR